MSLLYAILVTSPPHSSVSNSALKFAQVALDEGHAIVRVFFMAEGVECGKVASCNDSESLNWLSLASTQPMDLVLCSSSAVQRGVFDQREAERRETQVTLANGFTIGGLALWLDTCDQADRIVRFGE